MNVYGVFRKAPPDSSREIVRVSKDRSLAEEWIKTTKERGYYVETFALPFEIGDAKEIYTLEGYERVWDVFVDIGIYFLTYDEARKKRSELERNDEKYSIRTVYVL